MQNTEHNAKKNDLLNSQGSHSAKMDNKFLRNIRHDLGTPIHSILGFIDLLDGQYFGELNSKQVRYIKQIENNSITLLSLINNVVDILLIDSNGLKLDLNNVSPSVFIDGAVEKAADQFSEKDVAVNAEIEKDLPFVMADVKKCEQIMLGILMLSLKNMPAKSAVKISAYAKDDDQVMIRVGKDIDLEKGNKVLNINTDKTDILIAFSHRCAELHGGEFGIERDGTFWFTLKQSC